MGKALSKHFGFMLWRDAEKGMLPKTDWNNCLLVYESRKLAEQYKPALGVVAAIGRDEKDEIIECYKLAGFWLVGQPFARRGKKRDY